jgi:hypothetical protein
MKLSTCLAAAARRAALPLIIAAPLLVPTAVISTLQTMRWAPRDHPGRAARDRPAAGAHRVASAAASTVVRGAVARHISTEDFAKLPPGAQYRYRQLLDLADSLPASSGAEELDWAEQGLALYRAMTPAEWERRLAPLPQDYQWQVRRRTYELMLVCTEHYLETAAGNTACRSPLKRAGALLDRARAIWTTTHTWHRLRHRYAGQIGDSTLASIAERRAEQSAYTAVDYYIAARQAARQGEPEAVDRLLACALARDPHHLPSLRLWAMELNRRQAYGPACAVASAMIAIWPQDDRAYALRAAALGDLQLYREAGGDQMIARERRRDPFPNGCPDYQGLDASGSR